MRTRLLVPLMVLLAAAGCRTPDPVSTEVVPAAAEPASPAPELRLRFRVGDVARFRSRAETDMRIRMGPRSAGAVSSEEVEVTHRVVALTPEGNGVVEVTIDASALSCEVPGFKKVFSLDTRKPETVAAWKELCRTDPAAHMLAPLVERVGGRIRITIQPDGGILDARTVGGSAEAFLGVDDAVGIPYVLQLLGSVDSLPGGSVAVGLGAPLDQTYESPAGRHSTKGRRTVTAWDPATGRATVATEAKILFYAPLESGDGKCSEPSCPGMPPGFRLTGWTVRGEEILDLQRGARVQALSTHSIAGSAESRAPGGPAPTFTAEMKVSVEELR